VASCFMQFLLFQRSRCEQLARSASGAFSTSRTSRTSREGIPPCRFHGFVHGIFGDRAVGPRELSRKLRETSRSPLALKFPYGVAVELTDHKSTRVYGARAIYYGGSS